MDDFIEKLALFVQKYAPQYNILVNSPIIAQGILESKKGTSDKVYKDGEWRHNYFGLKWRNNRCQISNDYFEEKTAEQLKDGSYINIVSKFCKFKSMEDCVIGYFQWINIPNYSNLKGVTDPRTYLENIKADKYATSIKYVDNLMAVIEKYNLTQYDTEVKTMKKKIALDAGHGLKTSGKQTPDGIKEWYLNDKVRDKIVELLKGYDVEIIFPDNNEGNTDESLSSRRSMYINANVDVAVSIHHNANTGTWNNATGVEVFTDKNPTAADKELASLIYARLPKYTGLKGRGIKKENWYVINQNKIPAVLVEGGFMDGKNDYKVITSEAGQNGYAKAVAEALIDFLDLERKTENVYVNVNPVNGTKVRFLEDMNVRTNAGTQYKIVTTAKKGYIYTIVDSTAVNGVPWGKLKSGAGWVCIDSKYCVRV